MRKLSTPLKLHTQRRPPDERPRRLRIKISRGPQPLDPNDTALVGPAVAPDRFPDGGKRTRRDGNQVLGVALLDTHAVQGGGAPHVDRRTGVSLDLVLVLGQNLLQDLPGFSAALLVEAHPVAVPLLVEAVVGVVGGHGAAVSASGERVGDGDGVVFDVRFAGMTVPGDRHGFRSDGQQGQRDGEEREMHGGSASSGWARSEQSECVE
ncbi:hypothetical protein PG990_003053 [Apiospora arundinis]